MAVHSLGYLRLEATDLDAWRTFGGDFLGLMPVEGPDPASLYFRMDEHPPRLIVSPGETDRAAAIGFEVLNPRELDRLVDAIEGWGIEVRRGSEEEAAARRVTGFAQFADPGGNPIELFYGPVLDHVRVLTPDVSQFLTGDMGMGHVIVTAEDGQAEFDFYTEVLGFLERNTMATPGGTLWFLGCNPRHHTLGIIPMPGPGRLIHFMVEVATMDDVGRAIERAGNAGVPMMQALGRHSNDHMVSFYVYSPEKYAVEVGWSGLQIPQAEPTYAITKGAFWGHAFSAPPG